MTPSRTKNLRRILKAISPEDAPSIVVQELTEKIQEAINKIPVPKDGEDGKDAKPPTKEELLKLIKPLIPEPKKGEKGGDGKDAKVDLNLIRREVSRYAGHGGGNANRNIAVGGNGSVLSMFTDINLKAGSNVTLAYSNNANTKYLDLTISATGDGGIVRSVNSISTSQTAGAIAGTDYVYVATVGVAVTLPTAVGNANLYTIKNVVASSVLVATTGGQTIDTSPNLVLATQFTAVELISDGANWNIT